jgi:hypothetical protein
MQPSESTEKIEIADDDPLLLFMVETLMEFILNPDKKE